MPRQVLHNVQVARFFAAGCVLVTHTADLFLPHSSPIFALRWTLGVDMFFVISGFIMVLLTRGCFGEAGAPGAFFLRRLVRIAPPYWLFTTLMIASAILFDSHVRNATVELPQVVTSYAFLPWPRGDGKLNPLLSQGWTLNYEAFFYAAFAAALFFRRGLAVLALTFLCLVALHPWVPRALFMFRFWSDPIILEFLGGAGLALLYVRGWRLPLWGSGLLLVLAGLTAFAVKDVHAGMFDRLVQLGTVAFLLCTALALGREPKRPGAIALALRRGGDASYALYLSHTFTINAAVILWRRLGLDVPWAGMTVAMVAAVAVAILFYQWIERPLTDALQRYVRARPLRGAASVAP